MKALTDDQLWDKIRSLQGQIVRPPQQDKPNLVMSVSEDVVKLYLIYENRARKANPSRDYILRCYRLAMQYGFLTKQNLPQEFFDHRIARICMGLLAAAVPAQIRAFRRGEGPPAAQGLAGIEVYNKDC